MNQQASALMDGLHGATVVELLQWRARHQADEVAYVFLVDGEQQEDRITYGELDRRARAIADRLDARQAAGLPVLLLYPSGLRFIEAFFGVLYAGAIAVPAYPPRRNRADERLDGIVRDCGARHFLTDRQVLADLPRALAHTPILGTLQGLATDDLDDDAASERSSRAHPGDPAFLQYTSGSTQAPKGVVVSHGNLMSNLARIDRSFAQPTTRGVGWLPMFHDMGLIGNTLEPLYLGAPLVFMSPVHFLQKPARWLQAISRYRATTSGGPNFAYELCVEKTTAEERAGLDLQHWNVAFNGAEPVRSETIERFAEAFAPCGFRREAFLPCYGLAEATLIVASGRRTARPVSLMLDAVELARNQVRIIAAEDRSSVRAVVGCGQVADDECVRIVDPTDLGACAGDRIGEIWVASDSVAQGYWQRPDETAAVFGARLPGRNARFLRTGDLGFVHEGELFVTGRLKDLIVLRGRNHYPQDIEHTAEAAHAGIRAGACAAFAIDVAGEEQLAIVFETDRQHARSLDVAAVFDAVWRQVLLDHDVQPHAICALKPGTLPKTSSGKIQRSACRQAFLDGSLEIVGSWRNNEPSPFAGTESPSSSAPALDALSLRDWLSARLAQSLKRPTTDIAFDRPFAEYGVDSVTAVQLSGELETRIGRRLPPTLLYDCPTIDALVRHLEEGAGEAASEAGTVRPTQATEPIAIVGMACRFPGAPDLDAFWTLLREETDAITEIPAERWKADDYYDPEVGAPGKMNTRWGGFLSNIDRFDADFFRIAPREAVAMDPQQRLLLELAHEALEDAAIAPARLRGTRTGVFIGICNSDYGALLSASGLDIDPRWATGNAGSIAANRISYVFDFKGASLAIDTACSSSLVSVHLACRSLLQGESSTALAGGVNLILRPDITVGFSAAGGTSPHGRCKAFGAGADGMVRSEGAGLVVLKRLSDALADGDRIHALIPGSAVNHDGLSNGMTAPNAAAQEAVIRDAYAQAQRSPQAVQYVEAHGTGTPLGDPIEAQALGAVLSAGRPDDRPCGLGSVKSNIGHTEAAAGVASLIKVALALRHGEIPATLHSEPPHPHIAFESLRLRAQQRPASWRDAGTPHLAGVSAFGFGGTNAHVVVEQAPAPTRKVTARTPTAAARLLSLSARTPAALTVLAGSYLTFLEQDACAEPVDLDDLCYTAAVGRDHHACRLGIVFSGRDELAARLRAFVAGEQLAGMFHVPDRAAGRPTIAWVFSGHRGQRWSMSREWLDSAPAFRAALQSCDEEFRQHADWPLIDTLLGETDQGMDPERVDICHPCQFAYQVALAAHWRSLGVVPAAIVGHSFGEVAAAHVAGVLSLADAVRTIFLRSRCLQQGAAKAVDRGAMATVELPRREVQALLDELAPEVSIAVNNSPTSVVLTGPAPAVERLIAELKARQVFCNLLSGPGAGHHSGIDVSDLARGLDGLKPMPATLPLVSSVLGAPADGTGMDAGYWVRNVQQAVLFADAVGELARVGCDTYLEIAPYPPVLSYAVSQCLRTAGQTATTLPVLRRNASEQVHLLGSLAALYAQGHDVDWQRVHAQPRRRIALPSYPWQRTRYWIDSARAAPARRSKPGTHPWLQQSLQSAAQPELRFWEVALDVRSWPFLRDHQVQGAVIAPTTAYLELALAAGQQVFGASPCSLRNLVLEKALFLPGSETRRLQLVLTQESPAVASIRFYSRREPEPGAQALQAWEPHARIEVRRGDGTSAEPLAPSGFSPATVMADYPHALSADEHYRTLRDKGIDYGPAFQGVTALRINGPTTIGEVRLPAAETGPAYLLHPALLDACLQVLAGQLQANAGVLGNDLFLPVGVAGLTVHAWPAADASLWSRAVLRSAVVPGMTRMEGDVQIMDAAGRVLVEVQALALEKVGSGPALAYQNADACLYEVQWHAVPRPSVTAAMDAAEPRLWVLLADETVGPMLAHELHRRGQACISVAAGPAFERLDAGGYRIRAGAAEDHERLAAELAKRSAGRSIRLVHLWSLLPETFGDGTTGSACDAFEPGGLSIVMLLQQMAAQDLLRRLDVIIVTRQSQSVDGEPVAALQTAAWSLGKVIGFEHSELACSLVDLPADASEVDVPALLEELLAPRGPAHQVALRRSGRHEPRLQRLSLSGSPAFEQPMRLRTDASYLVTGGLSGIGLRTAQWLAERGARHLVLMGRSGSSTTSAEAIQQLEARGVQVHVARADVADATQVAATLAEIAARMPPLRGVVHAAAIVDPGLLRDLDGDRFRTVMAPKVAGAWNLHRLTEALPLDFFVMYSSVASLFGTPGQGNYVAANAFLDGLAHQRRSAGLPALTVNWGGWSEVGLVARHAAAANLFAMRGFDGMPPETGLAALEKLLCHGRTQAAAMLTHWPQVWQAYPQLGNVPFFAELRAAEPASGARGVPALPRGELLALPTVERQAWLRRYLVAQLALTLGVVASEIEVQRPINTMGIDSLMALEVKNRIEAGLRVTLPIVKFLEGANVAEIATLLLGELEHDTPATSGTAEVPPEPEAGTSSLDSGRAAQLLARVDEMSDAEVESLLAALEEGNA